MSIICLCSACKDLLSCTLHAYFTIAMVLNKNFKYGNTTIRLGHKHKMLSGVHTEKQNDRNCIWESKEPGETVRCLSICLNSLPEREKKRGRSIISRDNCWEFSENPGKPHAGHMKDNHIVRVKFQ